MWFMDLFRRNNKAAKVAEPYYRTGGIVPLCGDAKAHFYWKREGGFCPTCERITDHERMQAGILRPKTKYRYQEEIADAVADAVVDRLRKEGLL
jgi:hypothetical protein